VVGSSLLDPAGPGIGQLTHPCRSATQPARAE